MADDALLSYALAREKKRIPAAVIGYYGYGNLGDEETLSVIASACEARGIEVIYPTGKDENRGAISRIRAVRRAIRHARVIMLGGGNLIQNETSIRSLIYYCEAIKDAKRRGRRVLILSSGLGDIKGQFWRKYAMRALL